MTSEGIRIVAESWDAAAATALRDRMDAEIHPRYADILRDPALKPSPVDPADIVVTLVAYDGVRPVGTVSLKRTGSYAEVKRVFVDASHRRSGLAARLLTALEDEARERGFRDLVLQTGSRQPEASALYEREGWTAIPPFGPYADDDVISRCYAKPIDALLLGAELPAHVDHDAFAGRGVEAIRALDEARLDFIVVTDRYLEPTGVQGVDAPMLATFAAARTSHSALVPVVTSTHTEPFHVAKVIQTLDFVSRGRAGWQPGVETESDVAALFGRKGVEDAATLWAEADEAIEVATLLWDSWEDDAEIRDLATGRFIDRDRVHHIDFEGRFFSVKGPSIVPRSPQGQPPIVLRVPLGDSAALAVAARRADVIRVSSPDVGRAREALARAGRSAAVVVDLVATGSPATDASRAVSVRHDTGADGAVIVFERATDAAAAAAALSAVGSRRGGSFRDRLGLTRPASRFVREEIPA
ncbi:MAG: LLM class flavin-dependent oxidoreductase [Microbacterium sp.]